MLEGEAFELLKKNIPALAERLEELDLSPYRWTETREGEKNIEYDCEGKVYSVHSKFNIAKESERWFQSSEFLKYPDKKVFYIYGLGLAYSYVRLKDWLAEDVTRYVVFLEDDLSILGRFLEMPWAVDLMNNHQVILSFIGGTEEEKEAEYLDLVQYFIQLSYGFGALPHYELDKRDCYDAVQLSLHHEIAHINFACVEFFAYGAGYYSNMYNTMLSLDKSCWGYSLIKRFENIPAIVVGAGPSLNKNIDLLKSLSDRAIILAGGSSVNALSARGIEAHLGASVDPNPLQHTRMIRQSAYELPIFYKARINQRAFRALHGRKIYLPGSTAYPITPWIEENLGIRVDQMREGHNVLHLLIEMACFMGCNPIIFVGMDMSYPENQLYAEGVIENAKVSSKFLKKGSDLNDNCFERKDIYGNPVLTLWKWVGESEYSAQFPVQYPHIDFINCTEGGLGMGDKVPNRSLKDVAEEYLYRQYDLHNHIHADLEEGHFYGFSLEDVLELYVKMSDGILEVDTFLTELKMDFQNLQNAIRVSHQTYINEISEQIKAKQEKMELNEMYKRIFGPLNGIRSVIANRELNQIEHNKAIDDPSIKISNMCEKNLEELKHLKKSVNVNLSCMENALKEFSLNGYGDVSTFFAKRKKRAGV